MRAITLTSFNAGLSNQKIALAGLLLAAEREGCAAAWPPLVDFIPAAPTQRLHDMNALFDLTGLSAQIVEHADEARDPASLFHATMVALAEAQVSGALSRHPGLAILAAFRPAPSLALAIDAAAERFAGLGGEIVCQMRIERDWAHYLDTRLAPRIADAQDLTRAPLDIVAKIVASFPRISGPILLTCDTAGLSISPTELARQITDRFGLRTLFKHDLGAPDGLSPLEASLFDFELMVRAERMIGTTLSSFFGLAALTRLGRTGSRADAWAYNAPGPRLTRRHDNGVFANIAKATATL